MKNHVQSCSLLLQQVIQWVAYIAPVTHRDPTSLYFYLLPVDLWNCVYNKKYLSVVVASAGPIPCGVFLLVNGWTTHLPIPLSRGPCSGDALSDYRVVWLSCLAGPLSLWPSINFLLQLTRTKQKKPFRAVGIPILLSLCVAWGHCGCLALLMMNSKGREGHHLTTWTKAGKRGGVAPFSLAPLARRRGKHLVNITYYSGVRTSCVL